ncbi:MAG: hypothetical protein J4G01_05190 [Dehalococcoidia bacterium]|nr:hypothetical protein [Dehalococcoidia bacterium]
MCIIEYLNENSGAVTAIATLSIAVSAIVSLWISKELAKENRLLRKASTEPEVAAYLKSDSRLKHARNLVLANVGQGPAKNVMFTIRANMADFKRHQVSPVLPTNSAIKAASFLPQGESIESFFGTSPSLSQQPQLEPFEVEVTYEDLKGTPRAVTYTLDVAETKWVAWLE